MDVVDVAGRLVRRWYLTLPLLGVVLVAVLWVSITSKQSYQANAAVLFVAPIEAKNEKGEAYRVNPYTNFTSSLRTLAIVVWRDLDLPETRKALAASGVDDYEVAVDENNSPILYLYVSGTDPEELIGQLQTLFGYVQSKVATLQEEIGAPDQETITVRTLNPIEDAVEAPDRTLRSMLAVGAVGLLAAIGIVVLVDIWLSEPDTGRHTRSLPGVAILRRRAEVEISDADDESGEKASSSDAEDEPEDDSPSGDTARKPDVERRSGETEEEAQDTEHARGKRSRGNITAGARPARRKSGVEP